MNNYKQYFTYLNEDYNKTSVISQLLELGYSIDTIVKILDNTNEKDVVGVLNTYAQNKMKWAIYERWQRRFGNDKKRTETEALFG